MYATGYSPIPALEILDETTRKAIHYDPNSMRLPVILEQWQTMGSAVPDIAFHGFYEGLDLATVGLFYGRDSIDDGDAELVGLEAATTLMGGDIQGALGSYDGDVGSGSLLSVDARYAFGGFAATGFAGAMSGDVDGSRIALGAEYQLGAGPTLYGEVGRRSVDDDGQTYLSLGARLAIGPNAGTTFESRSIFEILPGF